MCFPLPSVIVVSRDPCFLFTGVVCWVPVRIFFPPSPTFYSLSWGRPSPLSLKLTSLHFSCSFSPPVCLFRSIYLSPSVSLSICLIFVHTLDLHVSLYISPPPPPLLFTSHLVSFPLFSLPFLPSPLFTFFYPTLSSLFSSLILPPLSSCPRNLT